MIVERLKMFEYQSWYDEYHPEYNLIGVSMKKAMAKFEKSAESKKEPKGMKEGSKKEVSYDMKQMKPKKKSK
jgi:hypothetical protein